MVHLIEGRRLVGGERIFIGAQDDNNVEVHDFVLPRMYGNVDLSHGIAYILYSIAGESEYVVPERIITDEVLTLRWTVDSLATAAVGEMRLQLKIGGLEHELWHSEVFLGEVIRSLRVMTPMTIAGDDAYVIDGDDTITFISPMIAGTEPDNEPHFTVSERTINVPSVLQSIAVQGDARSETVYIDIPRWFDGHDLSKYSIYMNTIMSGGSDIVPFMNPIVTDSIITCEWTLKPPQTSFSGSLGLQIFIEGVNDAGEAFRWATAQTSVNIIPFAQAELAIPTTPTVMEEFLRQINEVAGQVREDAEIAAASSGSLLILGYFSTEAELIDGVMFPSPGDSYAVGTAAPFDIYTWDAFAMVWRNNGPIQGAKGSDGATFTPSVDTNGIISWSNNGGLTNPTSRDITGRPGQNGADGADGPNRVTADTATDFTGMVKGNGANMTQAIPDEDYVGITGGRATARLIDSPWVDVTANYTLKLSDHGATLRVNSTGTVTITVPANASVAFPDGAEILIYKKGSGAVTITAASGVTILNADNLFSLRNQGSGALLKKDGTNGWWLTGDMA